MEFLPVTMTPFQTSPLPPSLPPSLLSLRPPPFLTIHTQRPIDISLRCLSASLLSFQQSYIQLCRCLYACVGFISPFCFVPWIFFDNTVLFLLASARYLVRTPNTRSFFFAWPPGIRVCFVENKSLALSRLPARPRLSPPLGAPLLNGSLPRKAISCTTLPLS